MGNRLFQPNYGNIPMLVLDYLKFKAKYVIDNWRMLIRLLFRTEKFGVNNQFVCKTYKVH